jgi:hypothetical protein
MVSEKFKVHDSTGGKESRGLFEYVTLHIEAFDHLCEACAVPAVCHFHRPPHPKAL